jgi:hypothetical protein
MCALLPAAGVDVASNTALLDALDDGIEPDRRRCSTSTRTC